MRGKKTVLAVVALAAMLLVSAVALAHEGRLPGTQDSDELTMSDGNDRVFARGGDDSVDGGAGNDRIRGGRGDDELYGGDGDEIVCGNGYDVAVLGRGDVVEGDDGCEKVRRPKGKHRQEKRYEPCAANSQGCDDEESIEEPCAARFVPRCGDPEVVMPEPDEPVEEPEPDDPGEH